MNIKERQAGRRNETKRGEKEGGRIARKVVIGRSDERCRCMVPYFINTIMVEKIKS